MAPKKTPKKNPIELDQVRHIAKLAQLELSSKEELRLQKDLNRILGYFERLDEISIEGVQPQSHPLDLSNVFAEDKTSTCLTNDEALANAPDKEDGQFRVPAVLE